MGFTLLGLRAGQSIAGTLLCWEKPSRWLVGTLYGWKTTTCCCLLVKARQHHRLSTSLAYRLNSDIYPLRIVYTNTAPKATYTENLTSQNREDKIKEVKLLVADEPHAQGLFLAYFWL